MGQIFGHLMAGEGIAPAAKTITWIHFQEAGRSFIFYPWAQVRRIHHAPAQSPWGGGVSFSSEYLS
jgi:hypothetical protein